MNDAATVSVTLPRHVFKALLQRGVGIPAGAGASVRDFLQRTLGIESAYVEEKLQTVFLDHQPVDDFDAVVVRPGAVLALSGAMPGLVGATMRRGGYYARMREGITRAGDADAGGGDGGGGVVVVKLFNRPLADLADTLAARPLLAPADAVAGAGAAGAAADADGWVRLSVTLA